MRRFATVVSLVAILVAVSAGFSQSEDLSLDQAIELAGGNNPVVGAAAAEVEAADAGVKLASARFWPTLSASGSYGTFSGDVLYGRFIPGSPGDGVVPVGQYDTNTVANLELKQVLYAGGAIGAEKRLRDSEGRVADQKLRERRLEIEYQVTRTYFEAVLAEQRLEVAGRSVERSRDGLETVRARFAEEEALEVELLGARSRLAADELELLEASKALGVAHRKLDILIGRSSGGKPRLTTTVEPPLDLPNEDEAHKRVIENGPAVRQADLNVVRAEAAVGVARAQGRPKLELAGLYSWIDNDLFFKGDYAAVSLNLAVPFFQDIKAGRASKRVAEARSRQAAHLRKDAIDRAGLAVDVGYGKLEVARAAVETARLNLDFETENDRVAESAFREQLITFSELLDHHDGLSKAELALVTAHFEARMAEAEIRRLVGQ